MAGNINVIVCEDPQAVAERAAGFFAALLRAKPDAVIGLATGSTPEQTYAELGRRHREEGLSFARAASFNLDEYWGLDGDHDQSYRYFMNENLFDKIDIRPWNTHVLNGKAINPRLECQAFEDKILSVGGVDLWLLGIGLNGTSSVLYATLATFVPPRRRSRFYSFYYTTNEGASVLGPLFYGRIADLLHLRASMMALAILTAMILPTSVPLRNYLAATEPGVQRAQT